MIYTCIYHINMYISYICLCELKMLNHKKLHHFMPIAITHKNLILSVLYVIF